MVTIQESLLHKQVYSCNSMSSEHFKDKPLFQNNNFPEMFCRFLSSSGPQCFGDSLGCLTCLVVVEYCNGVLPGVLCPINHCERSIATDDLPKNF